MTYKEMFNKSIILIMNNKVNLISEEESKMGLIFEVGDESKMYEVRMFKRPGRTLMTCTCSNASRFPLNCLCCHKIAVLNYYQSKIMGLR